MTFIIGTLVFSTFAVVTTTVVTTTVVTTTVVTTTVVTTAGTVAGRTTARPTTMSCLMPPWELTCWPSGGELRGDLDVPQTRTDLRMVELVEQHLAFSRGDGPQPLAHGGEVHRDLRLLRLHDSLDGHR
jgi:hypothetical protein